MSISTHQKEQIINHFNLLTEQFIKNKQEKRKIKILFQEQEKEGQSYYEAGKYYSCFWDKEFVSEEFLGEVVTHEFTHIYFLINQGYHEHDEKFFSYFETF